MSDEKNAAEPSGASGGSLAAGIRKCIAAYEQIPWGWDGDCGANDIISRIAEECDKIDAARPALTLTDAEREAIETAMNAYGSDNANPECAAIEATLWGLLERTK